MAKGPTKAQLQDRIEELEAQVAAPGGVVDLERTAKTLWEYRKKHYLATVRDLRSHVVQRRNRIYAGEYGDLADAWHHGAIEEAKKFIEDAGL